MHIGIDASRAVAKHRTGTENYSLNLIQHMLRLDGSSVSNRYTLYLSRVPQPGLLPDSDNCSSKVISFPRLWTHLRLSGEMILHRPDVLFVPAHVLPLIHPRRSVVTVHDLGYLYYPEAYRRWDWQYLKLGTAFSARNAAHIIADSKFTRGDIVKQLGIGDGKIAVVYPGVGEEFQPIADKEKIAAIKAKYGIDDGAYILYVGTIQPRKNVARLIEAYGLLKQDYRVKERLVIAGKVGWLPQEIFQKLRDTRAEVTLAGFVPPEDLPYLYSGASVFVLPSLFEGFGMPVVEAMACGTPVVASNVTSLPEVVGDAGVLVDPNSVDSIAEGIWQVLSDNKLQGELWQKGLERAKRFSWQRAAEETLALLKWVGSL